MAREQITESARKGLLVVLIGIVVIGLDQLVKSAFLQYWPARLVENRGAAFGVSTPLWLILAVFILLSGLALWSWYKKPRHWEHNLLALALILGGAISNLLDRALYGFVLDYIDLRVWPVFNLADSAIFIGTILLLWYALIPQKKSSKKITSHVRAQTPRSEQHQR